MAEKKLSNKKDILLLLLYTPGETGQVNEPISGKTRLIKMIFLFKKEFLKSFSKNKEISEEEFYNFFAWNYGPFSKEVYDDLMFFELRGFVRTEKNDGELLAESAEEAELYDSDLEENGSSESVTGYEYVEEKIFLTEKGVEFAGNLYKNLEDEQKNILTTFKKKMAKAPLKAILRYVYENYPEQIEKSEIKEKVLGD